MITFDTSFTELGIDANGAIDEVPINEYLRSVHVDRAGVIVMDSSGHWGYIKYLNTAFASNRELFNYLYAFTLINVLQTKKIEICSADLRAANSVPIELVPAPGIGLIIMPHTLGYKNKYKSVVYDFAQNLFVHNSTKTEVDAFFVLNKGIVNAAANRSGVLSNIIPAGVSTADSFTENDSLVLKALTSDATQGDGYLTVYITYSIVEESWYDGIYCT